MVLERLPRPSGHTADERPRPAPLPACAGHRAHPRHDHWNDAQRRPGTIEPRRHHPLPRPLHPPSRQSDHPGAGSAVSRRTPCSIRRRRSSTAKPCFSSVSRTCAGISHLTVGAEQRRHRRLAVRPEADLRRRSRPLPRGDLGDRGPAHHLSRGAQGAGRSPIPPFRSAGRWSRWRPPPTSRPSPASAR